MYMAKIRTEIVWYPIGDENLTFGEIECGFHLVYMLLDGNDIVPGRYYPKENVWIRRGIGIGNSWETVPESKITGISKRDWVYTYKNNPLTKEQESDWIRKHVVDRKSI